MSEFGYQLGQWILKGIYSGIYKRLFALFSSIFNVLNDQVTSTAVDIQKSPTMFNPEAFSTVKSISTTAFLPVAGAMLAVVFCWEMVRIVQDSNAMQSLTPQKIVMPLIKLCVCIVVCAKAFDIINAFFDLGAYCTSKITGTGTMDAFGAKLSLESLGIPETVETYTVSDIIQMFGYLGLLCICWLAIHIIAILIYLKVIIWFMEIYITSVAAPMPYSTWMNRDWSQVGMNYTRKMLGLVFQGPLMLVLYAIYGGVMSNIGNGGDFVGNMGMIIGCSAGFAILLFKIGNIADSVFAAH